MIDPRRGPGLAPAAGAVVYAGAVVLAGASVASADVGAQGVISYAPGVASYAQGVSSYAQGVASYAPGVGSYAPGVGSGKLLQVPIHVGVNACGNTIGLIGLLDPSFGNACVDT